MRTDPRQQPDPQAGKYAGLRIGVIIRNSTQGQIGNWRSFEQEAAAVQRIVTEGGQIIPYDEQGTSGRDLAKRAEARQLLDDIQAGTLDGLFALDIKRLTRDEYGADAGTIARRLAYSRALLLTESRDYHLWRKDDLRLFRIEAAIAGGDLLDIRDQLYSGMLSRGRHEAFFRACPPFGYTTQVVEQRGTRPGEPTRLRRVPQRDPVAAVTMARMIALFGTCLSLGEVAEHLNREHLYPQVTKGPARGSDARWVAWRLRAMLDHPLYWGQWEFGRQRRSTLWDGHPAPIQQARPDLAYWTRSEAEAWQARLVATKWRRTAAGHDRPLRGVLICDCCGALLNAGGAAGYICGYQRLARHGTTVCAHPQKLSHAAAMQVLRAELPRAVAAFREWRSALAAHPVTPNPAADLESQLTLTRERLVSLTDDWYGETAPATVPRTIRAKLADLEETITRLEADLRAAQSRTTLSLQATRAVERMTADPMTTYDAMPPEVQAEVLRLVFAAVRIHATGWAGGRRHTLVSYTNLLTASSEGVSPCALAKLATLVPE